MGNEQVLREGLGISGTTGTPQTPVVPTTVPVGVPTGVSKKQRRQIARATRTSGFLAMIGDTVSGVFILCIGGTIWWIGAYFTLLALATMGVPVQAMGNWQWAIPLAVSVLQVRWYPTHYKPNNNRTGLFAGVSLLDLGSTMYGLFSWAAGLHIPIVHGITIPEYGTGLWVAVLVLSLIITFAPERLVLWAIGDLKDTWGF